MSEAIYLKILEGRVYIRAEGHVTAVLCADLRDKVYKFLAADGIPQGIVLDLSRCDYMDSTFMGVIVSMNKKLRTRSGQSLVLQDPTPECMGLLKNLGILKLLTVGSVAVDFPPGMDLVSEKKSADSELVYTAHEELSQISPENRNKFKVLQDILRQELKR